MPDGSKVLMDGRERREQVGGFRDVVESDERDVTGDAAPCLPESAQCPESLVIVAGEDRRDLVIGSDVLPDSQKVSLETARVIRVGFLQQNAFHANDTYVPLEKQKWMMQAILHLYDKAVELVGAGVPVSAMLEQGLFDKLLKVKYEIPNDKPEMFGDYEREMDVLCAGLLEKYGAAGENDKPAAKEAAKA